MPDSHDIADPLQAALHPAMRVPMSVSDGLNSCSTFGHDDIFFAAVGTTRMPMIVSDPRQPDNPIVFANRAFKDLTGYTVEELVGRNCRFLQGPETDRGVVAQVREAVAARREFATEILNYRKDGSTFWNALFISPIYNRSGELVYFFSSQLDISRRRDAEDALRQAQKMEALGQFTGSIAHDFNNLLQVIVGYLDTVTERVGIVQDPELARALAAIAAATDRGGTLTRQLLGFARKQRLDGRVLNLNLLVETMREMASKTLGEAITVKTQLDPDLWTARLDPVQAEMAVLNLLLNARDAMPGGGRITIETYNHEIDMPEHSDISDLAPGRYAVLAINDTGTGMTRDVLARALDPFFTTKEPGRGTGLGLSMAYGFMRQSDGGLRLSSKDGEGTIVRLYFPAADKDPAGAAAPAAQGDARLRGNETVLVVEDQPDIAALATAILTEHGYAVMTAANADIALALLEAGARVDLLFSDLIMPGEMNGVMLARAARRRWPGLRVLLATGFAAEAVERDGALSGEFDILGKPYRRAELLRRMRDILDGPAPRPVHSPAEHAG